MKIRQFRKPRPWTDTQRKELESLREQFLHDPVNMLTQFVRAVKENQFLQNRVEEYCLRWLQEDPSIALPVMNWCAVVLKSPYSAEGMYLARALMNASAGLAFAENSYRVLSVLTELTELGIYRKDSLVPVLEKWRKEFISARRSCNRWAEVHRDSNSDIARSYAKAVEGEKQGVLFPLN